MTRREFQAMVKADFETIMGLNDTKGHDYAGDEDALRNFKEQGQRSGVTPVQAWSILSGKHMMAIETYVREGDVASEPIEGRIHDAILYLFLLLGLHREKTGEMPAVVHRTVEFEPEDEPTREMAPVKSR